MLLVRINHVMHAHRTNTHMGPWQSNKQEDMSEKCQPSSQTCKFYWSESIMWCTLTGTIPNGSLTVKQLRVHVGKNANQAHKLANLLVRINHVITLTGTIPIRVHDSQAIKSTCRKNANQAYKLANLLVRINHVMHTHRDNTHTGPWQSNNQEDILEKCQPSSQTCKQKVSEKPTKDNDF